MSHFQVLCLWQQGELHCSLLPHSLLPSTALSPCLVLQGFCQFWKEKGTCMEKYITKNIYIYKYIKKIHTKKSRWKTHTYKKSYINQSIPQKCSSLKEKTLQFLKMKPTPKNPKPTTLQGRERWLYLNRIRGHAKEYKSRLWGVNINFLFTREQSAE